MSECKFHEKKGLHMAHNRFSAYLVNELIERLYNYQFNQYVLSILCAEQFASNFITEDVTRLLFLECYTKNMCGLLYWWGSGLISKIREL